MPKTKNIKKNEGTTNTEEVRKKDDIKKLKGDEEVEKESGTLSDGVLDAFDEVTPADILLLEEETLLAEEDEEDELDSGEYRSTDEW